MTPGLRARRVSYSVQERALVRNISLDVHFGEVLAVVGPNGAGKSTLCGLLAGDITPTEGAIDVCGRPVCSLKTGELAHLRAMLSQHTALRFPFTAREVALMGRHPHIRRWRSPDESDYARTADALEKADALYLAERIYPTLSGGEQRRVSVARVLAQDTPVVLFDEPTAALDIRHQQIVMGLCRQLADDGRAVLAVLHDLNLAGAFADRVLVMLAGEAVAIGDPDEVLSPELLSAVFDQKVIVVPHPQTDRPVVLTSSEDEPGMRLPSEIVSLSSEARKNPVERI